MAKLPKLGSGERFKKLANKFSHEGVRDPAELAAYEGRKKYGSRKMTKMAQGGKRRREE